MSSETRIRDRIASLHELRNVVQAMRGMAATRIEEAQRSLEGIRNYVTIVENALGEAARLLPDATPAAEAGNGSRRLLIVIAAEHGFVGQYNDAIFDALEKHIDAGTELGVVGRLGSAACSERGFSVAWQLPGTSYPRGIAGVAQNLAKAVTDYTDVSLLFARYQAGGGYRCISKPVLPPAPELLIGADGLLSPIHHLEPERLLEAIAREYLFAELTLAMMEGLASENAARLATMQAADQNVSDRLDDLTRQERELRQEAITLELLEIVTGSEALNG